MCIVSEIIIFNVKQIAGVWELVKRLPEISGNSCYSQFSMKQFPNHTSSQSHYKREVPNVNPIHRYVVIKHVS